MRGARFPALVLGGVRSGKSTFAERLAEDASSATGAPVVYIATAEALDGEMQERIQRHRIRRPVEWRTVEEPVAVSARLRALPSGSVVLLECLTLLVNNWIMDGMESDRDFDGRKDDLLDAMISYQGSLIVVSNEVGLGVMPANALARHYADWLGLLNQSVAVVSARVLLMVAGRPLEVRDLNAP